MACPVCGGEHGTTVCPNNFSNYYYGPERKPHRCPVCNGYKTVSKPPHINGDVDQWVDNKVSSYPCPACNATGIIWEIV